MDKRMLFTQQVMNPWERWLQDAVWAGRSAQPQRAQIGPAPPQQVLTAADGRAASKTDLPKAPGARAAIGEDVPRSPPATV